MMPMSVLSLPVRVREHPVLLIDDSALQREYAAELLETLGVTRVLHAGNGRQALEQLRRLAAQCLPLPLLMVDLGMPEMDGIEFLTCLREEGLFAPVILASACEEALVATVRDMVRALRLPLLGSLPKPLCGRQLHGLLEQLPNLNFSAPAEESPRPEVSVTLASLREALRKGQVRPHYQPKVQLDTGQLLGYEVLARWHDPMRGMLY